MGTKKNSPFNGCITTDFGAFFGPYDRIGQSEEMMSRPTALPLREAPKANSSHETKRKWDALIVEIDEYRARVRAVQQERELRKQSDPDIGIDTLAEYDRRQTELTDRLVRIEEILESMPQRWFAAANREWEERMTAVRAELERQEADEADELYRRIQGHLVGLFRDLTIARNQYSRVESFNQIAGKRLGYVMPAERRIRNSDSRFGFLAPLWEGDALRRLRAVYPGDGFLEFGPIVDAQFAQPPKLPPVSAASTPSPERCPGDLQPKFFVMPRGLADEAPVEAPPKNLVITVHGRAADKESEK